MEKHNSIDFIQLFNNSTGRFHTSSTSSAELLFHNIQTDLRECQFYEYHRLWGCRPDDFVWAQAFCTTSGNTNFCRRSTSISECLVMEQGSLSTRLETGQYLNISFRTECARLLSFHRTMSTLRQLYRTTQIFRHPLPEIISFHKIFQHGSKLNYPLLHL